jgi:hypothetical protein
MGGPGGPGASGAGSAGQAALDVGVVIVYVTQAGARVTDAVGEFVTAITSGAGAAAPEGSVGGVGEGVGATGESAGAEEALRAPGEGTGFTGKWGDPSSVPTYGHSKSVHGAKRPPQQLLDRARGKQDDQGQWYDDNDIVEAEQRAPTEPGFHVVDLKRPIGRVYHPDGSITEGVTQAGVVRKKDGAVRSSFPYHKQK